MHNHSKNYNQATKQVSPRISRNPAVWKSDNHGFKDGIFIQTGRRGGDSDSCKEAQRDGKVGRDEEWAVPHPHVVDKNWEGYLGSEGSSPRPDHAAQSSNTMKVSPHNFWL